MSGLVTRVVEPHRASEYRLLALVLGSLLLVAAMLVAGTLWTGWRLDRVQLEHEHKLVEHALHDLSEELERLAVQLGESDLAAAQTVPTAPTETPESANAAADGARNYIVTVDATGATRYAEHGGRPVTSSAEELFGPRIGQLTAAAGRVGAASFPLFIDKALALLAAAPWRGTVVDVDADADADGHVLVAQLLGDRLLEELRNVEITRPRIIPPGQLSTRAEAAMPLTGPGGIVVGHVAWLPQKPGSVVLAGLSPVLVGALVLLASAALLAGWHLQNSATQLRNSEQRFRDFAEISSDWLWETDAADRFTYLSERHGELLGIPVSEQLGKTAWELRAPQEHEEAVKWAALRADVDARRVFKGFRLTTLNRMGHPLHLEVSGLPVYDELGVFQGYRGTGADITAECEAAARAAHLACHDPLTGLANRVRLHDRLTHDLDRAARTGEQVAVLCLDLDRFKAVNDSFGHAAGDAVLIATADRLRDNLRPHDLAARLGGDEFALLLPRITSADAAMAVAERLVQSLALPIGGAGRGSTIGASIGIARFPTDATDMDSLLRCADQALYRAKAAGRGRATLFEAGHPASPQSGRAAHIHLAGAA